MSNPSMPPSALVVLAEVLDRAAYEFGNHSCNDFDLAALVPSLEERRAIMRYAKWQNGSPEDFDPDGDYEVVSGFVVMRALGHWVREQAKEVQ